MTCLKYKDVIVMSISKISHVLFAMFIDNLQNPSTLCSPFLKKYVSQPMVGLRSRLKLENIPLLKPGVARNISLMR